LEGDDVPAESVAQLASDDPVFEFLDDAREDLYSASDGVVV
jgi:hypothetical protein